MAIRDAANASIRARQERTRQSLDDRRRLERSAVYAGQNLIQRLGAESTPTRNRRLKSNRSRNEPVAAAQGLLDDTGNIGVTFEELEQLFNEIYRSIEYVFNRRGVLFFQGDVTNPINDPNDTDNGGVNRAYQRYDNQLLYNGTRTERGSLWVHAEATVSDPETWLEIQTGSAIVFSGDPPPFPVTGNPTDGDRWVHEMTSSISRLWIYKEADDVYQPTSTLKFYQAAPSTDPDWFVNMDTLFVYDEFTQARCEYVWVDATSSWLRSSCCDNGCPDDAPSECTPPAVPFLDNNIWTCSIPGL